MKAFTKFGLVLICAVLVLTNVAPVYAATAPTQYAVKPGVIFNNPRGSKAQQLAIINQVNGAIDHAPKNATIRIAQYLFDIDSSADALIAAHARGVNVQMLIDDNTASPQTTKVRKALGTDKTKLSFVATCKHSCMSSSASVMHAKFFTFSTSGSTRTVSMVSSANLYTGNTYTSWNNIHTIVGDATLYNSLHQYFTDMLKDKDTPNYYRTTTSGLYKLYFFPRVAEAGSDQVALLDVLNHVSCSNPAAGYGYHGHTLVKVEQWGWTSARMDIAKQLWNLHNQGCTVQVIDNNDLTNSKVTATLLKKSAKYGVMRVDNAHLDTNHNGKLDLYMHHKVVTINGVWFGHNNTKVVYTGSANFTGPGTKSNNEIVLRVKDNATYSAYDANYNFIRDNWTTRVTKAPSSSAAQDAQDNQIDTTADTDNNDD